MNKDWSEQNKLFQKQLRAKTFPEGIQTLLQLRQELMQTVLSWRDELPAQAFWAMPFPNAAGYHSKTIAYSLWHIFRIEDIVVNSLIRKREEVFFAQNFRERTGATIITTGNELEGEQIAEFSRQLDPDGLYEYIQAVKADTDAWLLTLQYPDLKTVYSETDKADLHRLGVVSEAESAIWLLDYWCSRDLRGLLQMPLSRHWIMHIEAAIRIRDKIAKG